jgi:hypothetical protein
MADAFRTPLELRCLSSKEAEQNVPNPESPYFRVLTPLRYQSNILGGIVEVPVDFLTDLGSIPRLLWWWLSPDDYDISYPSVVHDYLYKMKGDLTSQLGITVRQINRETADRVLKEAMASVGASGFHQSAVFFAVRTFGPRW